MTDWAQVQTAIPAAVRKVLGKRFDVEWSERRAEWRENRHCRLSVVSVSTIGRTERRFKDEGGGTYTERAYTPARLVVQFTLVADSQELSLSALPLAENVAAALSRDDVFAFLESAFIGINAVQPMRVVDFIDDRGRWRSSVSFDVWMNTHISVSGTFAGGDYVEQAEVTGDVDGIPITVLADGS